VTHHAIDQRPLDETEHVAQAGDDHVFYSRLRQRLLQHGSEILQDHDGFGAGIVELVFELARLVERVDVDHRAAGAQDPGDRHRVLQYVGHHQRHAVAALEAAALQPGGEGARGGIERAIGHRAAHADAGQVAREGLETFFEQRRERGITRAVDCGGNARRVMRKPGAVHGVSLA
jgi:hypothetical protein